MYRSGLVWIIALLALCLAPGLASAQLGYELPSRIPLDSRSEAQPPRTALSRSVTVSLSGNVAAALEAMLSGSSDWVVSAPGPTFPIEAEFSAADVPLWKALDQLLPVYGYDWGVQAGVVVCWPVTEPRRSREAPTRETEPIPSDGRERQPVVLPTLTPVEEALAEAADPAEGFGYTVHSELRRWHVMGRLASPDVPRLSAIAAAIGAVAEGVGAQLVWVPSAVSRLDAALTLVAQRSGERDVRADSQAGARERLVAGLLPLLGVQQWSYVRARGMAEIAFRELPTEVAATFVEAVREQEAREPKCKVDWLQPWRMGAEVSIRTGGVGDARGNTVATWDYVNVCCNVPQTDGQLLGF